jgi:hypothetical protein
MLYGATPEEIFLLDPPLKISEGLMQNRYKMTMRATLWTVKMMKIVLN